MTEQPPSAEALPSDIQHLLDSLDTDVALHLAARIKAIIGQRVSAETERCALVAGAGAHDDCEHGEGYMDGRLDAMAAIRARAPAERPAPPKNLRELLGGSSAAVSETWSLGGSDLPRRIGVEQPTQETGKPGCGTGVPFLDQAAARLMAKDPCSAMALGDIAVERLRQIDGENWTTEHDDAHAQGQLATAGAAYALAWHTPKGSVTPPPAFWPWHLNWWKPRSKHRNCVRAGALLVAELARHMRSAAPSTNTTAAPSALASTGEQPAPDEPLDYIGTEPPPVGYVRLGWACPRDEALRCSGCDQDDVTPDMCGSGHPAYRSQKWIEWAERNRAAPPSPAAVVGERARERADGSIHVTLKKLPGFHFILAQGEGVGALLDALDQYMELYLSAVASEHKAALLDARHEAAQNGAIANDMQQRAIAAQEKYAALLARLREPDVREAVAKVYGDGPSAATTTAGASDG